MLVVTMSGIDLRCSEELQCSKELRADDDDVKRAKSSSSEDEATAAKLNAMDEEAPSLLQLWADEPVAAMSHKCWKCGKDGATVPLVSTATGVTVYRHPQLRGWPGYCDW